MGKRPRMETIYFLLTMHDGHMLTVKKFVSSARTYGNNKLAIHCLPGLQIFERKQIFYALYVWGRALKSVLFKFGRFNGASRVGRRDFRPVIYWGVLRN